LIGTWKSAVLTFSFVIQLKYFQHYGQVVFKHGVHRENGRPFLCAVPNFSWRHISHEMASLELRFQPSVLIRYLYWSTERWSVQLLFTWHFCPVAYPGIFFRGEGFQQIQLRTEDRENRDLGR